MRTRCEAVIGNGGDCREYQEIAANNVGIF